MVDNNLYRYRYSVLNVYLLYHYLLVLQKLYTLLMCAARNNRLSVVSFLLDSLEHVDVELVDVERQSALHHAAQAGHREVAARIVKAGASAKVVDKVYDSMMKQGS